ETAENLDGPQVLQRTIEVLFLSIKQRKQNLYRQTGWQLNQWEAGSRGLFFMHQRRVSSLRRHQDT
ncbi:unnamed protein product, partial [Coregonus sp. 'balchen']